jgi:hypothetical protein
MKSTLYLTAKVLPGNKIEVQSSNLLEGQTVEVVIIISEPDASDFEEVNKNSPFSLAHRKAFLKLSISERQRILEAQSEAILSHYQEDSEWQELMAGDIIDY